MGKAEPGRSAKSELRSAGYFHGINCFNAAVLAVTHDFGSKPYVILAGLVYHHRSFEWARSGVVE